jgi:hypothetical protein
MQVWQLVSNHGYAYNITKFDANVKMSFTWRITETQLKNSMGVKLNWGQWELTAGISNSKKPLIVFDWVHHSNLYAHRRKYTYRIVTVLILTIFNACSWTVSLKDRNQGLKLVDSLYLTVRECHLYRKTLMSYYKHHEVLISFWHLCFNVTSLEMYAVYLTRWKNQYSVSASIPSINVKELSSLKPNVMDNHL